MKSRSKTGFIKKGKIKNFSIFRKAKPDRTIFIFKYRNQDILKSQNWVYDKAQSGYIFIKPDRNIPPIGHKKSPYLPILFLLKGDFQNLCQR